MFFRRLIRFAAVSAILVSCAAPLAADSETGREIRCRADKQDPILDFEFRFFTRYTLIIPVKDLVGPARTIHLSVDVTPLDLEGAEPVRFENETAIDAIPEDAGGKVEVNASFVTGEGRYHVNWQLKDSLGGHCSVEWTVQAKLGRREDAVRLTIAPGEVGDSRVYLFRPEKVESDASLGRPLRVKVFLNFDPWRRRARASVRLYEFAARVAALRAISRHPRIGEVGMVVYSVEEQDVLGRHGLQNYFDYALLETAIDALTPGLVDISQLGRDKTRDFFTEMLEDELPAEEPVDAYIFLGPDAEWGRRAPRERLAEIGELGVPVFALLSNQAPWRGLIGNTVKALGGVQFRFVGPRDLAEALEDIVSSVTQ